MQTMKTKNSNTPQNVLKSIPPHEEITVNVSKEVNGKELNSVLTGISAFTNVFSETDKYKLEVKVSKIIEEVDADGKGKLQTD